MKLNLDGLEHYHATHTFGPTDEELTELLRRCRRLEKIEAFLREHGERLAVFSEWAAMRCCSPEVDAEVNAIQRDIAALMKEIAK